MGQQVPLKFKCAVVCVWNTQDEIIVNLSLYYIL